MRCAIPLACCIYLTCAATPARGQCDLVKITASSPAASDFFGWSVAVSGDTAVVGAYTDDPPASGGGTVYNAGAAYVYQYDGANWVEQAMLHASDAAQADYFGNAVAIDGDVAVVGSFSDDTASGNTSGSAYIFRRSGTTWTEEAKLLASDGRNNDYFGESVAIGGDTVVIGTGQARYVDPAGAWHWYAGKAYVFRYIEGVWVEEVILTAPEPAANDRFGISVAISGDRILIGAKGDTVGTVSGGSVHAFRHEGPNWVAGGILTASDPLDGAGFGDSVSMDGDRALIGAPNALIGGIDSGAAYVFAHDGTGWTEVVKLGPTVPVSNSYYGSSVSINGVAAVVGAGWDHDPVEGWGAVYVYRYEESNWVLDGRLTAPGAPTPYQSFGYSVALDGNIAVMGYPYDIPGGGNSGSAYVYPCVPNQEPVEGKLTASDGAPYDYFGEAVAIQGDTALVGSTRSDPDGEIDTGAAYVYGYDGAEWAEVAKLTASDGEHADRFGYAVALDADIAVVGAYGDDDGGRGSGSAYVFRFDGADWVQEAKLTASDAAMSDGFGLSVAVSGDRIVVGAYYKNEAVHAIHAAGAAYVYHHNGEEWEEEAKLTAPLASQTTSSYFGWSVSISGNRALIGARRGQDAGTDAGAAYLFRYNGSNWVEEATLIASDAESGDSFGFSVSLSGAMAVIGAVNEDTGGANAGAAYAFRRDGSNWVEEAKLLASDGSDGASFGHSVSISWTSVVIGARGDDDPVSSAGSAYVFHHDGSLWAEETKLTAPDATQAQAFGFSVALDKHVALIGSPTDDDRGIFSGSAYVIRDLPNAEPVQDVKLTASDWESDDRFGNAVSVDGDVALVGAYLEDDPLPDAGSAYVFRYDGVDWIEEQKLSASDAAGGGAFGHSVSLHGDRAIIGAWNADGLEADAGAAYVFRYDGSEWIQEAKLFASDGAAGDAFGWSVSIRGHRAVIGAHRDQDAGDDSGSAYVFRLDGSQWIQEAKLVARDAGADDLFGTSVSINGDTIVIGAPMDGDVYAEIGSAYVFRLDGTLWLQEEKLTSPIPAPNQYFGSSVSQSADAVLIGAPGQGEGGTNPGAAYVYRWDRVSWRGEAMLGGSSPAAGDFFGGSVTLRGNTGVIGAYGEDDKGTDAGAAYIFQYDGSTWSEETKLIASDAAAQDNYGHSVAISQDWILVGAHRCDGPETLDSGAAYVYPNPGSDWMEEDRLLPPDPTAENLFGQSVSIWGNWAVVGAPYDADAGAQAGAAYLYRYDGVGWVEYAKFIAQDTAPGDVFGYSVSISGNRLVIGAYGDRGQTGAAYVFRYDFRQWIEEAKLVDPRGEPGDRFGYSASISGDAVVVGALPEAGSPERGAAHVFRLDGLAWDLEDTLVGSDTTPRDGYGCSVSVSGDWVVVGAFGSDRAALDAGTAYLFHWDGANWIESVGLLASDAAEGDHFGRSVALDGGTVVIGAYGHDGEAEDAGAAYVFHFGRSHWQEQAVLTASDAEAQDQFGYAVAIHGDALLIGAFQDDDGIPRPGAGYVFRYTWPEWDPETKLIASNPTQGDRLGLSVALSSDTAVIGARLDDPLVHTRGSVYIFRFERFDSATYDFYIHLSDGQAVRGQPVEVAVTLDFDHVEDGSPSSRTIDGWSYAICNDPEALVPAAVVPGEDAASLAADGSPFWQSRVTDDCVTIACVVDTAVPFGGIPAQNGWRDALITYAVARGSVLCDGGTTQLFVCECGDPATANVMSVDGEEMITLEGYDGGSYTLSCSTTFRRGDCNQDGGLNIGDGICVLYYLFGGEICSGAPCTCLDALDTNDDGSIDIADSVAVLEHLFADGPPLAEPFAACGFDETQDPWACESYPACAIPPVADFRGAPRSGCSPFVVDFTDLSSGDQVAAWLWTFGDGATSTDQNPSHTYDEDGTYTVTLTVTNPHGSDMETKTQYISAQCEWIIDDGDSGTSSSGTWTQELGGRNLYGGTAVRSTNLGATYTYMAPLRGTYRVDMWWVADRNRCLNTPVEIYNGIPLFGDLLETHEVNQLLPGGRWVELGTYRFGGTAAVVVVSEGFCTTSADAVRFTWVGP